MQYKQVGGSKEYFILTSSSQDNNTGLDWKLFVPKSEGYRLNFFKDFFNVKYEKQTFLFSQAHQLNPGMTRGQPFRAIYLTNYSVQFKSENQFYIVSTRTPPAMSQIDYQPSSGQQEKQFRFYFEEASNVLFQTLINQSNFHSLGLEYINGPILEIEKATLVKRIHFSLSRVYNDYIWDPRSGYQQCGDLLSEKRFSLF